MADDPEGGRTSRKKQLIVCLVLVLVIHLLCAGGDPLDFFYFGERFAIAVYFLAEPDLLDMLTVSADDIRRLGEFALLFFALRATGIMDHGPVLFGKKRKNSQVTD